jgi:hypothetical protein
MSALSWRDVLGDRLEEGLVWVEALQVQAEVDEEVQ